ncbi:MAG: S8 family serine peptidase [Bacteroidetes bacterium]|nr:S8 family serine peptidase [Bacteroidota bacterium]
MDRTLSYFPEVDICAPGHELMGLKTTHFDSTTINPWPFWEGFGGTSFSAPIVSGLCGLIKSINPVLNPAQVQDIIKTTTDPIVDAELYEINGQSQTGTGRINAYKAVQKADSTLNNYNIYNGQNITWTDTVYVRNYINIQPGGRLTIKSFVGFNSNARVDVQKGAKLIIDGGHLSGPFNSLWWGIEVWGDPKQVQDTIHQGMVIIKNNGIIENARIGIETDNSKSSPSKGGGIIICNKAVFKNNIIAVLFKEYKNENISLFNKCDFITTQELNEGAKFDCFVELNGVNGINFMGCSFENTRNPNSCDLEERGIGINSFDSQFGMNQTCNTNVVPCSCYRKDTLRGLFYGVRALGASPAKTCVIRHSVFDMNKTGIYLGEVDYASITENQFYVKPIPGANIEEEILGGLYLDQCNGYQVEENNFEPDNTPVPPGGGTRVGLVINNSGPQPNEIYNNYFNHLSYGTLAQNQNRKNDGSEGLQIKCNDYDICEYDIAVTAESTGNEIGIKYNQGSGFNDPTAPAGNTFSYTWQNDTSDYTNTCNDIKYWFHKNNHGYNIIPINRSPSVDTASNNQNPLTYKKDESCPSNLNPGGGGIEQDKLAMNAFEQKADSVQSLLNLLLDGGDTEALNIGVQTSWPDEAYEIYEELLSVSPYLSDTVMVSAVNKENVLSSAMVTDILVANPHSAKSDTVMQTVDNRMYQLSDDQRAEIEEGQFIISAKESLESSLSYYEAERSYAFNSVVRWFLNDTNNVSSTDSIIQYLESENKPEAKYALAYEYLSLGDSSNTISDLNSIPEIFNLSTEQMEQHQNYMLYFNLLLSLSAQGKSIFDVDSTQIDSLYQLLDQSSGQLHAYIRNILISIDTLTYHEPYIFPESGTKSTRVLNRFVQKKQEENSLKLYPNPACDYVVMEYKLKEWPKEALIHVYSIEGKSLGVIILRKPMDYLVIDTKDFKNGLYLFHLIVGNKAQDFARLIIHH